MPAELAGCSHHTVGRYVAAREEGRVPGHAPARRAGVIDPFLAKLEELVDRSRGKAGLMWRTRRSPRWGMPGRSGRPGGRSRR
jgi:hypothetical protein